MAIERGIKIYTVGLGKSYDETLLKKIASNTSGRHYKADDADALIQEFKKLTSDTIDIVKDTDNDGLSDYHEERIRIFNGQKIILNKNNPDTDFDKLKDGEEIVQRKDKYGRVFFKMRSHPNKKDSDDNNIDDSFDERPLFPDKSLDIDYLGSPKHLEIFNKKIKKYTKEFSDVFSRVGTEGEKGIGGYGVYTLIDDYNTFLKKRGIDPSKGNRIDYWKDEWDKYWEDYCDEFNKYVALLGKVKTEKIHYFRNNLNRVPRTLGQLNANAKNWVLIKSEKSIYHMFPTSFSGEGVYNLKFISVDGKHEGVYINIFGEKNKNKGLACTEITDPKNMGTYNYNGMYYKYGSLSVYGAAHYVFDVKPYDKFGNVSPKDLPKTGESISNNKDNFYSNKNAVESRKIFEKQWIGVLE